MSATDRCPQCGALYALVGRVHRCNSRAPVVEKPLSKKTRVLGRGFDRTAYQKEYMRKRRAEAKAKGK